MPAVTGRRYWTGNLERGLLRVRGLRGAGPRRSARRRAEGPSALSGRSQGAGHQGLDNPVEPLSSIKQRVVKPLCKRSSSARERPSRSTSPTSSRLGRCNHPAESRQHAGQRRPSRADLVRCRRQKEDHCHDAAPESCACGSSELRGCRPLRRAFLVHARERGSARSRSSPASSWSGSTFARGPLAHRWGARGS
jgi:hypothetical protein